MNKKLTDIKIAIGVFLLCLSVLLLIFGSLAVIDSNSYYNSRTYLYEDYFYIMIPALSSVWVGVSILCVGIFGCVLSCLKIAYAVQAEKNFKALEKQKAQVIKKAEMQNKNFNQLAVAKSAELSGLKQSLVDLKAMYDDGLISDENYNELKTRMVEKNLQK